VGIAKQLATRIADTQSDFIGVFTNFLQRRRSWALPGRLPSANNGHPELQRISVTEQKI
jgi:hypothetical protein